MGSPSQAEVDIHFHHSGVSVLRRHRMTVSSAEVQASWKTTKAVYEQVAAEPAPVMQRVCHAGAAFGAAAALPATSDKAAGTVGPASAEAAAKAPAEVDPLQLLNFLHCDMMHFYDIDVKVTWKAWGDSIVNQDMKTRVAVKNLVIALWRRSVLRQRTLTEVVPNVSLYKDSRPALTPKKGLLKKESQEGVLRGE
ncbi:uncharacterized protein ISCGN_028939 [Ixodes scapularis]